MAANSADFAGLSKQLYQAALDEEWHRMPECLKNKKLMVTAAVTASKDTALHLAVYSKKEEPLKYLIQSAPESLKKVRDPLEVKNADGNTILHEAAVAGNLEAVKYLLSEGGTASKQLANTNKSGETPFFTAASFGREDIVLYIISEFQDEILANDVVKEEHRNAVPVDREAKDSDTILYAAIKGSYFGTAVMLLALDESLGVSADSTAEGMTYLRLLAEMPSAFKNGYAMNNRYATRERIAKVRRQIKANGSGGGQSSGRKGIDCFAVIRGSEEKRIWEDPSLGLELTGLLLRRDPLCWYEYFSKDRTKPNGSQQDDQNSLISARVNGNEEQERDNDQNKKSSPSSNPLFIPTRNGTVEIVMEIRERDSDQNKRSSSSSDPLFIAAKNGIVEIVREILLICPTALEIADDSKQNILHLAVMHRQLEVFNYIVETNKNMLLRRVSSTIDHDGYTLLHQVADTTHYRGGTQSGPAFQLHKEVKWFELVKDIVPERLHLERDRKYGKTAKELFDMKHEEQLHKAQEWIKQTSQSWSAVAALIATVVFAAAYTLPGGTNDKGIPIFRGNVYFYYFTVLDVIALASSLTSVAIFLSLLAIKSDQCENFLIEVPLKLIIGFTLLSLSVMSTMSAFASALILLINSGKWNGFPIIVALSIPGTVLSLTQIRLLKPFLGSLMQIRLLKPFLGAIKTICKKTFVTTGISICGDTGTFI